MDKATPPERADASSWAPREKPTYRATFLFVAWMLAGFIVGWIWMLLLVLRRY